MILYFNPGHETAINNASRYYTPPANVVTMQHELAFLPAWYGSNEDVVFVHHLPDTSYFNYISDKFDNLPKPITPETLPSLPESEVSLWGISPQSIHFFEELSRANDVTLRIPECKDEFSYLNSRQAAKDCLCKILDKTPQISDDIIPTFCSNLEDIEQMVNTSNTKLLAKAPYSSSGRGLLWLPTSGLTRTERQILHGILKKQSSVSIERVLNKKADFAMEFISDGQGNVTFAGFSLFQTNNKGAYQSNYIGSQENIINKLSGYLPIYLIDKIKEDLVEILKDSYATLYKGCIGVDMLVYEERGEYKLHPCLEINMRYNMGYLALKLYENHILPSSNGQFYLDFNAKEGEIFEKHLQMEQNHPTLFESKKLEKGYFPLCPVNKDSRYWAYIVIEN